MPVTLTLLPTFTVVGATLAVMTVATAVAVGVGVGETVRRGSRRSCRSLPADALAACDQGRSRGVWQVAQADGTRPALPTVHVARGACLGLVRRVGVYA